MSNFSFVPEEFHTVATAARKAESHIHGDPRAACFHARFALETAVHWLYRHDAGLRMPYDRKLGALVHEPTFTQLLPDKVLQKVRLIHKVGNQAVHSPRPVRQYDALQVVKELHHLCYWLTRTYTPDASREGAAWRDERVPRPRKDEAVVPRKELEKLEAKLAAEHEKTLELEQERDAVDAEVKALREELAAIRRESEARIDTHDYSEAETRDYLIDVELRRAGWTLDKKRDREFPVVGMPTPSGKGQVDYVLWGDDGKPLAVVEAKKTTADSRKGRQQSGYYADCLEEMHGQRPLIFYTNGYETWLWDDHESLGYPPRQIAGFYKKEELARLIRRRKSRRPLDVAEIRDAITDRYYQKRAVGSILSEFDQRRRRALLVMATGTGKTRTAISLVDVLQRANWVKRVLFLADRRSLVKQATNAFKKHLPASSPVNLVQEKAKEGRVYVSTYPTMMGLIDETRDGKARFGVGHFDLVIIDEAHRSVYQRYREIFNYFDSFLVGLTATPSEQVDRNTYDLFGLETRVPTDAYELDQAVKDGYLVPPKVQEVDLRFPRHGIDYDSLSEEEKEEWEILDWGDQAGDHGMPKKVDAGAINSWLFNRDTVDKVLQHLMEYGHKVDEGDRLGKTILFARNHEHAEFVEERFNHHYPEHAGHFARVIDHYAPYPQQLIDDFSLKDQPPHIAISVDMMDTGIDVPEVVNLVFFKPVYSRIKFWQMVGRGTRLCEDLFGPGQDKKNFRIFDFCFNFEFFGENPEGIESSDTPPLGTRLFRARVELLSQLQRGGEMDPESSLREQLIDTLHGEVAAMHRDNFLVRMRSQFVDPFRSREAWRKLGDSDVAILNLQVAGLPSAVEFDETESRLFDLTVLQMQLALAAGEDVLFESLRKKVVDMAFLLEEKSAIPVVEKELDYLERIREKPFWEGIDLAALDELRSRLRGLAPFLDKKKRSYVFTNFEDEISEIRERAVVSLPSMTGAQYAKKVKAYLREHLDHIVIHRLRKNQPLTPTDLEELEKMLVRIGEDEGEELLSGLLARSGAPSLVHFVRSLVGMDREAAQAAFSSFLQDRSLTPEQIRFVELIIDQLTARGVMEAAALYEPPFTDLHAGGPDELFAGKDNVITGIFETLESMQPDSEARAS